MLAIAVLAFAVRAAVAVQLGRTALFQQPQLDSFEFLVWGQNVAHGVLSRWLAPTHGPGYPFFLGALLAATGGSLPAVRLAQAVLGAGLCVLAALLAARVFDRRAGLVTGLLLALYGPLVYVEVSLLAEGLFLFLLTAALLVLTRPADTPGGAAAAGVLLGLAAVTRATALPLLPVLAAILLLPPRLRPGWPGWSRAAAVWMSAAWLGIVAPVLVFVRQTRGSWLPVQSFGGLNFYMGNRPGSDGTPSARPGGDWDLLRYEPWRLGITGDAARERYFLTKAWKDIGERPSAFLAGLGSKALWLAQADEIRESHSLYFFVERSWLLSLLPGFGLLFPLALLGLGLAASRRSLPLPLSAYLVVMTATCIVIIVSSRYRLPLVPVLAVFAGGAVVWCFDRLRERRWRQLAVAAALLAAAAVVSRLRVHEPSHNLAEEWALSAASFHLLGRNEEAKQAAGRALAADPRSALAWVHKGRLHLGERDLARAEAAFERAVALSPDYQLAHLMLGQTCRQRGDAAAALRELRRSHWLVPDDPATLAELGEILRDRGETGEAARMFRRLLEVDPSNAAAWLALARIEGAAGRPRAGMEMAFRAARLAPGSAAAWLVLARFAGEAGELHLARGALVRARGILGPQDLAVEMGWALLDHRRGDLASADRRLREILRHDPALAPAARLLLDNAVRRGRREEAEAFLRGLRPAGNAR